MLSMKSIKTIVNKYRLMELVFYTIMLAIVVFGFLAAIRVPLIDKLLLD